MTTQGKQFSTINDYIRTFPPDVRVILETLRKLIPDIAPEAEAAIRYGIPTFRLNGNLVHFAAFEHHIGLYPTPAVIKAFESDLSPYHKERARSGFRSINQFPMI